MARYGLDGFWIQQGGSGKHSFGLGAEWDRYSEHPNCKHRMKMEMAGQHERFPCCGHAQWSEDLQLILSCALPPVLIVLGDFTPSLPSLSVVSMRNVSLFHYFFIVWFQKISILPPRKRFAVWPTIPLSGFSKIGSQNLPPPPPRWEFPTFSHTLWKYCYLLLKWAKKEFCSLGCQILWVSSIFCWNVQQIREFLMRTPYALKSQTNFVSFHVFSVEFYNR